MGVTGLWSVVAPTARPTKLETLNRKRLAVDASIWIYQFLKAVRDKEGNALRNSHVVGFFRRICKLLYFGILPVFVFDGGAPSLKRETIQKRRRRREGRREDATRTAGKLLAVQLARAAEEEEEDRRQRETKSHLEETIPEGTELVYVDELGMDQEERQKERVGRFKKRDQYHLPDLDVSLDAMGAPNDPRIMSQAELEDYARQFHSGEDINLYDFSKIDFESLFFLSLPAGDRYNILNAARLRSRLRMGYSKEQLDGMFPDRMAFSRFQIERVKERNELTQRLMHINGMTDDWNQGGRIAGEKGKEYILVKNDGVEGGWALGVVSNKQGTKKEDAIDIDLDHEEQSDKEVSSNEDEDFEDVAIEGLNRLPKNLKKSKKNMREIDYDVSYQDVIEEIANKRKAVYEARRRATGSDITEPKNSALSVAPTITLERPHVNSDLFVVQDDNNIDDDELFEDVPVDVPYEDEDLQRAIAMSLESNEASEGGFMLGGKAEDADQTVSDDDGLDLAAALAESRKSKYKPKTNLRPESPLPQVPKHDFSGPLPFESLNLGQSLLGKKKADKIEQNLSGGFDRDAGNDAFKKSREVQPLPSWFNASSGANFSHVGHDSDSDDHITYGQDDISRRQFLQRNPTKVVINLDEDDTPDSPTYQQGEMYYGDHEMASAGPGQEDGLNQVDAFIDLQATQTIIEAEEAEKEKAARQREERYTIAREIAAENNKDNVNDTLGLSANSSTDRTEAILTHLKTGGKSVLGSQPAPKVPSKEYINDEEGIEWSASDHDEHQKTENKLSGKRPPAGGIMTADETVTQDNEDETEIFEDVEMAMRSKPGSPIPPLPVNTGNDELFLIEDDQHEINEAAPNEIKHEQAFDGYLSESEEELMRQLALEAEGHAEFALELNQIKTPAQAKRDFEKELEQLRNQQKKDRRDADEVTQVMIQECQALLRLFGLPYLTAPMEAEAQCAELVHLGLVDGIVTDDSDIFLFGGTRIYKNMFNAAKFVECYVAQDLVKEYDLDRKKLIRFAHLLGSDYTEGIPGIGPVTALEIISDFPSLDEFKEWCSKVQLGRPQDLENQLTTPFRRKFKKSVQKRLFLPPVFPDLRVDLAYLNPEVDSSPELFQWGIPDLDKLRSFLMATIGWSQDRTDEILVPVIRDMNKRQHEGTQANITRFFSGGAGVGAVAVEGAAPRNRTGRESGRMKNAYARLRGEAKKKRMELEDGDLADEEDAGDAATDEVEEPTNASKRKGSIASSSQTEDDSGANSVPRLRASGVKKRKRESEDV